MRHDRMNDMMRQLDEKWDRRFTELHREMGAGGEQGQERTMTITDEKSNPMVIPYDAILMDAIGLEQEAKAPQLPPAEDPRGIWISSAASNLPSAHACPRS